MTTISPAPKPEPSLPAMRSFIKRESDKHKLKRLSQPKIFSRPKKNRKPVPARNKKRQAAEFARCYHSKARVAWVKALPCVVCSGLSPFIAAVVGPSDNAHTESGGAGRKSGYETIVPLCRNHHRRLDEHRKPFERPEMRQAVKDCAPKIQAEWEKFAAREGIAA